MIGSFFSSKGVSTDEFVKILSDVKFNQKSAEKALTSIDKNYLFKNGDSFIDICLRKNRIKAAQWLADKKFKLSTSNLENISAIRYAIQKEQTDLVSKILNNYTIDINEKDQNGRSLLQDSIIAGNAAISKLLISKGIDVNLKDNTNRNVIYDALDYGDVSFINMILNVNGIELNNIDSDGNSVLHDRHILQDDDLAEKFLNKGADPSICDKKGYNFLTYTALRGEEARELLELAIKKSSNLDARAPEKNTALLDVLIQFTKIQKTDINKRIEMMNIAQLLVEKGASVNVKNESGETILFDLIKSGDIEACKFVLKNNIEVNMVNGSGETPLYLASIRGAKYLEIVSLLLKKGANPLLKNRFGHTIPEILNEIILHLNRCKITKYKKYLSSLDVNGRYLAILKEVLAQKQYKFQFLNSKGDPLFFEPFLLGDLDTTKLYLKLGFDINQLNGEGYNLFYKYVLSCFIKGEYFDSFKDNLVFLLINKSNINLTNKQGQTIYLRIALIKNCNLKLFRKLAQVTKFDHYAVDSLGRSVLHSCVLSDNNELFDLVYGVGKNVQNIPDSYNLLPITYAAVLGRQQIVIKLLKKDTIINSGKPIAPEMKKKLRPMLKNLAKLRVGIEDPILMKQLTILAKQIVKDFS